MFISLARTVLSVERAPRVPVDGLGMLNEMEMEQIRALVEAAGAPGHSEVREGEFDLPLNRRRLRYLSVRLESAEEAVATGPGSPAHRGSA